MARGSSRIVASLVVAAIVLRGKTVAMPWVGPQVTPMGMMPLDGISPIPTSAPGERPAGNLLFKRACKPIPETVCGFVSSNSASSLTCNAGQQCVRNGNNFGCCSQSAIELCTNIYTSCIAYFAGGCGDACISDPRVLKCPLSASECQTFSFAGAVTGYSCAPVGGFTDVAWIQSLYTSGCIPDSTNSTTSRTRSTTDTSSASTTTSDVAKSITTTTSTSTDSARGTKLPGSSIAGIVIGSLAAFAALAGGILFFIISHKRVAASTAAEAAAAAENENDKSNNTSSACTPPLTQTPSRQSGRPYSIQSTRTPPSGYYAVPTNHPDLHQHPNDSAPNVPKKSNMRFSIPAPPTAASSAAAAALASNTHKPRARRYSTPTPAGGRMSPAVEVEGEGGDRIEPLRAPGPVSLSARTSTERLPGLRGTSPLQNNLPVPPPGGETRRFYGVLPK